MKTSAGKKRNRKADPSYRSGRQPHHDDKKLMIDLHKTECHFCGEDRKACLEFHHVDPETKLFHISASHRRYGVQKILDELAKCIVVCANCHRLLHAGEIEYDGR